MDSQIRLLEEDIRAYQAGGDAKYYSDRIKNEAAAIADCNCMSAVHVDRLKSILDRINADQGLRWVVYEPIRRKLWNLVYRGREALASSFYTAHNGDLGLIDCIDLKKDVTVVNLTIGTTLFQWCRFLIVNGKETIYDPDSGFTTVGEYFSFNKVPQEQLGINPYFDLYEVKTQKAFKNLDALKRNDNTYGKKYYSIGKKICCQFVLPFSANALVSTAKGAFDTWSVQHDSNRSHIEAPWYAIGGAKQVFIPLDTFQKKQLAETAMYA